MFDYDFVEINIDQVDFYDVNYVFTFAADNSSLISSIKQQGIINPPILQQKENKKYLIVCGSKRIGALKQLQVKKFTVKILKLNNGNPTLDFFLINLYDNIGSRELNQIEKADIISKLINLYKQSRDVIAKTYLPLLGLGTNPKVIDRYLPLNNLESQIKKAIANESISIDVAHFLATVSPEERLKIFDLFDYLKLGRNRQKEFIRLLQEIKIISNKSIIGILDEENIQNIIQDHKLTSAVKINRIKKALKNLRYPVCSKVEEEFKQIKKYLKLPPNLVLHAPPFFESKKYSMEITFKNQAEFTKLAELLKLIAESEKLSNLENLV